MTSCSFHISYEGKCNFGTLENAGPSLPFLLPVWSEEEQQLRLTEGSVISRAMVS
jgi:hypothetical protein